MCVHCSIRKRCIPSCPSTATPPSLPARAADAPCCLPAAHRTRCRPAHSHTERRTQNTLAAALLSSLLCCPPTPHPPIHALAGTRAEVACDASKWEGRKGGGGEGSSKKTAVEPSARGGTRSVGGRTRDGSSAGARHCTATRARERGAHSAGALVTPPGMMRSILENSHSLLHRGQALRVFSQRWMQSRWKTWPQVPHAMLRPGWSASPVGRGGVAVGRDGEGRGSEGGGGGSRAARQSNVGVPSPHACTEPTHARARANTRVRALPPATHCVPAHAHAPAHCPPPPATHPPLPPTHPWGWPGTRWRARRGCCGRWRTCLCRWPSSTWPPRSTF